MLTPSVTPGDGGMTPRLGMTPSRDSFGLTPKGTPIRDELHINEGVDMHESAKLELRRQADLRRNLRSGLSNLPQPKNEYQIVIQPVPEDNEEPEEHIEESMSDRMAREKRAANRRSVSVSVIEDFEENELKEAGYFTKEEVQFLRLAMGHENESLDEFVEAHKTCLNDIMYFPTRNGYGLSSVAGNMEKLAALQNEFENVKKRMDDDTKKAQRLEQKIKTSY
ncbi:hypothetical protein ACSBR2_007162 [Camellia fascicularis]